MSTGGHNTGGVFSSDSGEPALTKLMQQRAQAAVKQRMDNKDGINPLLGPSEKEMRNAEPSPPVRKEKTMEEKLKELKEVLPAQYPDEDVNLEKGELLLSSSKFAVIFTPKDVHFHSSFIVVVMGGDQVKKFVIHPGSVFSVSYMGPEQDLVHKYVYYSGVQFPHDDEMFLVLHSLKD